MSSSRIEWLDTAKGLGTLLVIIGHNLGFIHGNPEWHRYIYTFHMPLFFLATGCTINTKTPESLLKRAATLAIPYLVMSTIMLPVTHYFEPTTNYTDLIIGILYGTGHTIDLVPLWFLTCTASSLVLIYALLQGLKRVTLDTNKYIIHTSIALLVIGYANIHLSNYHLSFHYGWGTFLNSGLPWNLDLAPIAAGYMLLGKAFILKFTPKEDDSRAGLALISMACLLAIYVFTFQFNGKIDLNFRRIDGDFVGIICSLLGIIGSLAFCIAIQKYPLITTPLSTITQSGLIILWLHGGLQNKGFRIIFGKIFTEQSTLFWIGAFVFATTAPILIDRFIIKKSALKSAFYPKIR